MEVKLCYKTYPIEFSLGAMKKFNDATDADLWHTLLSVLKCDWELRQHSALDRLTAITKLVSFDVAAQLFYCLIDKSLRVPLDEVRDAMFRVGFLPTERDGDMSEPYPFVLIMLAHDISDYMSKLNDKPKKKADI